MRIINRGRGSYKTVMLISTAYVMGKPIIVSNLYQKNCVLKTARQMGVDKDKSMVNG